MYRPSHLLEVLNTYIISVEEFSIFRQDWIVAGLRYNFSLLYWGYRPVAKHLPTYAGHQV
jgi:hypothetical protein